MRKRDYLRIVLIPKFAVAEIIIIERRDEKTKGEIKICRRKCLACSTDAFFRLMQFYVLALSRMRVSTPPQLGNEESTLSRIIFSLLHYHRTSAGLQMSPFVRIDRGLAIVSTIWAHFVCLTVWIPRRCTAWKWIINGRQRALKKKRRKKTTARKNPTGAIVQSSSGLLINHDSSFLWNRLSHSRRFRAQKSLLYPPQ